MSASKLREIAGKLRTLAHELDDVAEDQEGGAAEEALRIMERSCQSKRAYDTPEGAGQAASDRGVDGLRVYPCTFCKKYHLTKLSAATFQQRREK